MLREKLKARLLNITRLMGGTGGQGLDLGSVEPPDKDQHQDNEQVQ